MDISALACLVGDKGPDVSTLTDIQIIGRLKSIHELCADSHSFKPGQIVRHKFPDLANSLVAKTPGIFVRYLDNPVVTSDHPEAFGAVSEWSSMTAAAHYDCVMGFITGGSYVEFLEPSSHYHLATEAEYGISD